MWDLPLWSLFPVTIIVSGVSVAAGVGGGLLYAPLLVLGYGVAPLFALATALVLELFGFASGLVQYVKLRSIDYSLVKKLVHFSALGTIMGVLISRVIPASVLQGLLVVTLIYLAFIFLRGHIKTKPKHPHYTGLKHPHPEIDVTSSITGSTMFGGGLVGLLSGGLGEINEYNFLTKIGLKPAHASGTSVALVSVSALVGITMHFGLFYIERGFDGLDLVVPILSWAVPGVVVGAAVGVRLATHLGTKHLKYLLASLFVFIAMLALMTNW